MSTFGNIERYWSGLKYIRRALQQKAEGIEQVDLGDEDVSIPDLMAMLEKASSGRSHEEGQGHFRIPSPLLTLSFGSEPRRHG
jgi:hypothetical protein